MKAIDHTGQRFGRLIAIERVENTEEGKAQWLCSCDCGNEKVIRQNKLKETQSCGCILQEHGKYSPSPDPSMQPYNLRYGSYKYQAKTRGHCFELTHEQFRELVTAPCVYCGDISEPMGGIDRVDNAEGYTVPNCVPCCKMCNYMKKAYTVDEFLSHIKKISENI